MEDFALIAKNATAMRELSEDARWRVSPNINYLRLSAEFQDLAGEMATKAKDKEPRRGDPGVCQVDDELRQVSQTGPRRAPDLAWTAGGGSRATLIRSASSATEVVRCRRAGCRQARGPGSSTLVRPMRACDRAERRRPAARRGRQSPRCWRPTLPGRRSFEGCATAWPRDFRPSSGPRHSILAAARSHTGAGGSCFLACRIPTSDYDTVIHPGERRHRRPKAPASKFESVTPDRRAALLAFNCCSRHALSRAFRNDAQCYPISHPPRRPPYKTS